jgi:hypothetical protein
VDAGVTEAMNAAKAACLAPTSPARVYVRAN